MASVKIICRNQTAKNGLSNIYIRLVHNRKKADIPIKGLKVSVDNWDDKFFVKKSEPTVLNPGRTNEKLIQYQLKAMQTINSLAENNTITGMEISDVVAAISIACFNSTTNSTDTICDYFDKVILQFTEAKKFGTAHAYKNCKRFVERRASANLKFSGLTISMLKKMETAHFAEGNSVNSLACYMRILKALYNKAVSDKLASKEYSPFGIYKLKLEETKKRAISLADFKKIKNLVIDPEKKEFHTQKFFLFQFYMRGMNYTDMAKMKVGDIEGDRLVYKRSKTRKYLSVKISPQAKEIIDFYASDKPNEMYVFPIIKHKSEASQYRDITSGRISYNILLGRMAGMCGITAHLSSYVSRHSWATISKYAGISVEIISEGLGHSDLKTTQIYLDSFSDSVLDAASDTIANLLDS